MAILKTFRPRTPARVFTVDHQADLTKKAPSPPSIRPPPAAATTTAGSRRASAAAGNKQRYRVIDWKRNRTACPAASRRSSTTRTTARIALLHYVDGEKAYILAPDRG